MVASAFIPSLRFPLSCAAGVREAWEHSLEEVQGALASRCSQKLAPWLLFTASEEALWCEEEEAEHRRRQQEKTLQKTLVSHAVGDLVESFALEVLAELEAETEGEVGHQQRRHPDAASMKDAVGLGRAPLPVPQASPRTAAAADLPWLSAPPEAPSRAAPEAPHVDRHPVEAPAEAAEGFRARSGVEGIREEAKREAAERGREAPGGASEGGQSNGVLAGELMRAWDMLAKRSAKQLAPLLLLVAGEKALAELRPKEGFSSWPSDASSVSPEKPPRVLAAPSGGGREEVREGKPRAAAGAVVADVPVELFEEELQGVFGMLALRSGKQLAPLLLSGAAETALAELLEAPGSPSPKARPSRSPFGFLSSSFPRGADDCFCALMQQANGTALPSPTSLSSGGKDGKVCAARSVEAQRETEKAEEKRAGAEHGRGGGEAEERAKQPRREDGSAPLKDLLVNGSERCPFPLPPSPPLLLPFPLLHLLCTPPLPLPSPPSPHIVRERPIHSLPDDRCLSNDPMNGASVCAGPRSRVQRTSPSQDLVPGDTRQQRRSNSPGWTRNRLPPLLLLMLWAVEDCSGSPRASVQRKGGETRRGRARAQRARPRPSRQRRGPGHRVTTASWRPLCASPT